MARQGPQHEAMVEAFAKRLRQLYPEPPHVFSEGRRIKPVDLKPDVYVRHPDGRQWAFEMVYGNSHAEHLLGNHERYVEAGIHDIWVFWDDLTPKSGAQPSLDQGLMLPLLGEERIYRLTSPQLAVLEMQSGSVRYLYAFALNPPDAVRKLFETELMLTLAIGMHIYRFVDWQDQEQYPATYEFVSIAELEFASDGSFVIPRAELDDQQWETLFSQLGLNLAQGVIPSELLAQAEQFLLSPEKQQRIVRFFLETGLKQLSPQEVAEMAAFFQSGPAAPGLPPDSQLHTLDVTQAINDASVMQALAEETELAKPHLENVDLPAPLKELLLPLLNAQLLAQVSELMKWQSESEAVQRAREEKSK